MKLSGNRIYSMKLFTKVAPLKNIYMNESNWLNTLQIYSVEKSPLRFSHMFLEEHLNLISFTDFFCK